MSHGDSKFEKIIYFPPQKKEKITTMEFNLMTSNIRFESEADGKNNWRNRRGIWKDIIDKYKIDILCTQEGRIDQLHNANEIIQLELVESHRRWISERMYPCIFINKNKFSVLDSGDFWLSETPNIPGSKSFNSAFPRLCTWVKLQSEIHHFFIFNCHLDHVLSETRFEQSKVIVNEIKKITQSNAAAILAGDFNEGPSGGVRKNITDNLSLVDPLSMSHETDEGTHHRFSGDNKNNERIDWIMVNKLFSCHKYKIIKDNVDGQYPSDHFPVYASLSLE